MNTAPSLHKLQTGFARWMLGERGLPLPETVAGNGLDSEARLQIYRNIIFNNLTAALRTAYPAVLKLVGEDFFSGVAARFIRDYPSSSGNLQDFGAAFPECLAAIPEVAALPYLADVARLEWARQQAYLAADAEPLDPYALGTVPDDRQGALRLTLHPSVRLLESPYPILD
ncbi:MAG: HvfC/BufC family peptide modification chaperone, partial [Gammaproteobacteria bacterium]